MKTKSVQLLYGRDGMELRVPDTADVLEPTAAAALADPAKAVREGLASPIGSPPLVELLRRKRPRKVAITISDITRPVPNQVFLPTLLETLNAEGIADGDIVIVIGTGMHRPSTPEERLTLLGCELLARLEVIDHQADHPETLVQVSQDPPISINARFARADFRIVTGYIEPHFMAGFSGGRKGVCPALVDLATIQKFHGHPTLAHANADTGILEGNPCHEVSLGVARQVGVDFLLNVSLSPDRKVAGVYCGDLVAAHVAGCADVAKHTTAVFHSGRAGGGYDLVVTNGGGYPLDQTFYQTNKGMCTALPALGEGSTLLIASHCGESLGSAAFAGLLATWGDDWRGFLRHIATSGITELDQWALQMQSKVLERIGQERLWLVSDGIPAQTQRHIAVTPILGPGDARVRAQRAVDEFVAAHPDARLAVIPGGPYTMLREE